MALTGGTSGRHAAGCFKVNVIEEDGAILMNRSMSAERLNLTTEFGT